jgi:ATP-dependent Clp protease ATP-binding subunit ClpC
LEQGITLEVSERFMERLIEEGYNPSYGARPLRRAIMRLLEDSLAEEMLAGRVKSGITATVDVNDDGQVQILSEQTRELLPQAVE